MNYLKQPPGKLVFKAPQKRVGDPQRQKTTQTKMTGVPGSSIRRQTNRTPLSAAAFRPPTPPKILQAKRAGAGPTGTSRGLPTLVSGVVQANVIGGTHALQARLNGWHTKATGDNGPTAGATVSQTRAGTKSAPAIQRKSGPGVEAFRVPLQPKSGGLPIPDNVRAKMETAFGADFSDVRVHIGQEASSLGAIAYTWGSNIHFAPGQYNPNTIQGQKLLGHELWHVVQQRSGRVNNPFGGGVAVVQDHALEAEADRMGIKAAMTALVQKPGGGR